MKNAINFLSSLIILPTFLFINAVGTAAQTKDEILIVGDRRAEPGTRRAAECLAVKRLNEEKFSPLCQNIANFKYSPGYFYVLEVRVSGADASGKNYRLRRILAQMKSENVPAMKATADLFGTQWKLTKINGESVGESKAFIKFDEQKKSAGGNGGCNAFGGQMTKNGAKIKISQIFSTKMFCREGSEIESKFLGNLEKVTEYSIAENRLSLKSGSAVLLEFASRDENQ